MLGRITLAAIVVLGACVTMSTSPAGATASGSDLATVAVATDLPCTPINTWPVPPLTTDVRLDHDVTCPIGTQWVIGGGVTVDLAGHTVTTPPIGCAGDPFGSFCNFAGGGTLRNGRLVGASVGLASVDHLVMTGGSEMVAFTATANVMIDGLLVVGRGKSTVTGNWLVRTPLRLDDGSGRISFTIANNVMVNSPTTGIRFYTVASDATGAIEGNVIVGSASHGIQIYDVGGDLPKVSISRNVIVNAGGDGIDILYNPSGLLPTGPVTIGSNTVLFSQGHGVNAPTAAGLPVEVVDGGHNLALFNRTRPQCVGVRC